MISLAAHHYWIAPQIYDIQREYYNDNELTMMYYLIKLVVSFQTMDGRNDKDSNQYGLRNSKHNNRDGGLSINEHGSNNDKEEEEEEGEDDRPHLRRRVNEENNEDPEENLEVPREIDFEGNLDQILNSEGREGGHEDNNGQRGALHDTQDKEEAVAEEHQTIKGKEEEVVEEEVVEEEVMEE